MGGPGGLWEQESPPHHCFQKAGVRQQSQELNSGTLRRALGGFTLQVVCCSLLSHWASHSCCAASQLSPAVSQGPSRDIPQVVQVQQPPLPPGAAQDERCTVGTAWESSPGSSRNGCGHVGRVLATRAPSGQVRPGAPCPLSQAGAAAMTTINKATLAQVPGGRDHPPYRALASQR